MAHSLLPPRGIFIPTSIIFNAQLPTAVILTWIRLRSLAWHGWSTPAWSIPELASLLGIHPNRLSSHLYQLREINSLSWRTTHNDKVILSFPEEPAPSMKHLEIAQHFSADGFANPVPRDIPEKNSYFPPRIMGYLSNQGDLDEDLKPDASESLIVERVDIENYLLQS
jgi:hypothetical protein